jgi:hypothetical protein
MYCDEINKQIKINNQLDYYKNRLLEQHLLNNIIIVNDIVCVPIAIHRQLGSIYTNTPESANNILNTLKQYTSQFTNTRIIVKHSTIKRINRKLNKIQFKPITHYNVYYKLPLTNDYLNNLSSKQLGFLYGYNPYIIF